LLAAGAIGVLHLASECEGGQIKTANRAQQCDGFVFWS
jgi:hypothetical protein